MKSDSDTSVKFNYYGDLKAKRKKKRENLMP